MTKHYEVIDTHTGTAFMTANNQDQLLDALWHYSKKHANFATHDIYYVDVFEEHTGVVSTHDEDLQAWFDSMDDLSMTVRVDEGPDITLNFFEYLALNGYAFEFTESMYPPTEIDYQRYFAQVKSPKGVISFHDGATKVEAAARAWLHVRRKERNQWS